MQIWENILLQGFFIYAAASSVLEERCFPLHRHYAFGLVTMLRFSYVFCECMWRRHWTSQPSLPEEAELLVSYLVLSVFHLYMTNGQRVPDLTILVVLCCVFMHEVFNCSEDGTIHQLLLMTLFVLHLAGGATLLSTWRQDVAQWAWYLLTITLWAALLWPISWNVWELTFKWYDIWIAGWIPCVFPWRSYQAVTKSQTPVSPFCMVSFRMIQAPFRHAITGGERGGGEQEGGGEGQEGGGQEETQVVATKKSARRRVVTRKKG